MLTAQNSHPRLSGHNQPMNTSDRQPIKMSDVLSRLLSKQEKRQIRNQRRIVAAENLRDSAFFRSTPSDRAGDTLREVR